jgi:hypothetical protein
MLHFCSFITTVQEMVLQNPQHSIFLSQALFIQSGNIKKDDNYTDKIQAVTATALHIKLTFKMIY